MDAPVAALQQQPIHFGAERGNVRNDLDVVGLDQLLFKTIHAVAAGWNIRTAAFIRGNHARSGHMFRIAIVVQYPREMDDVRCVCTDDSETYIRAEENAPPKHTDEHVCGTCFSLFVKVSILPHHGSRRTWRLT